MAFNPDSPGWFLVSAWRSLALPFRLTCESWTYGASWDNSPDFVWGNMLSAMHLAEELALEASWLRKSRNRRP